MNRIFGPWSERFWSHVNKFGPTVRPELGPCWVREGCSSAGYGMVRHPDLKRMFPAHRIAYEIDRSMVCKINRNRNWRKEVLSCVSI